jgi:hypothetical protein
MLKASTTTVDTPSANFTNSIMCNTITTSSTVSASYTPGAGSVW